VTVGSTLAHSQRSKSKGFTLIEVLVALVILSATFAAVWGWLNTSSATTSKIATRIELQESTQQFLDYLSQQPLEQQASGQFILKDFVFEYEANISRRSDQGGYRRQPAWIVALFDVDIRVFKDNKLISQHRTAEVRYWSDPSYIDIEQFL
jgi:prepilin-type N-terminal cleavage/methylation domain-containing protein